jgi:tyrosyl-tRNA synthetase
MSKTWGNAIWLDDAPDDMFGKVMSLSDSVILPYLTLATTLPMDTITEVSTRMTKGENPMNVKKELAVRIVTELHSPAKAVSAKHRFEQAFQKRNLHSISLPSISIVSGATIYDALGTAPFLRSKSESKRLISAGTVSVNEVVITIPDAKRFLKNNDTIRVGKQFGKVELNKEEK